MFTRILVPLDGSALAEQALPVAAQIARASQATVLLLHVSTVAAYTYTPSLMLLEAQEQRKRAVGYLASITAHTDALAHIHVQSAILAGTPADTIVDAARMYGCDLIVMSSHGATGLKRWMMGSVAQQVVRCSTVPVLVVNESANRTLLRQQDPRYMLRVWVPLDGTPEAEAALMPAARLSVALAPHSQRLIHLVRIVPPVPYAEDEGAPIAEDMTEAEIRQAKRYLYTVEQKLLEGDFAAFDLTVTSSVEATYDVPGGLMKMVRQEEEFDAKHGFERSNVIVIATHGRKGLPRWLMGSVTERLLGMEGVPLLTIRNAKQLEEARDVERHASAASL